jgi:hypothetical protein
MKGLSGSPYDFTPKVADFGLYSRVRTAKARSGGSNAGLDHYGNQRFSKYDLLSNRALTVFRRDTDNLFPKAHLSALTILSSATKE